MNFYQLECFVRAIEHGNFASVASDLYVTQPAITYQITNLEEELKVHLFYRTKRGVVPTKAGLAFYEDAKELLARYSQAVEKVKKVDLEADQILSIGFSRYPDNYEFMASIQKFRNQFPDVTVDVKLDRLMESTQELKSGLYDLVLYYNYEEKQFDNMRFIPLGQATYYVLMSEEYSLADREALSIEDLKGHKVLTPEKFRLTKFQVPSLEILRRAGADVSHFYADNSMLFYAISAGVGVGIYPARQKRVAKGLIRIPLVSQRPLQYGLLCRKDKNPPMLDVLVDLVREAMEEEGEMQGLPDKNMKQGGRTYGREMVEKQRSVSDLSEEFL